MSRFPDVPNTAHWLTLSEAFSALRVYALLKITPPANALLRNILLAMVTLLLSLVGAILGMVCPCFLFMPISVLHVDRQIIGIKWTQIAVLAPPANCASFPTIAPELLAM